ncbi:MAG TPA: VTT domain-containing protein [Terriglobales bacterium]|nr:VTT domain-containing protein [Terriglobales bacterium]
MRDVLDFLIQHGYVVLFLWVFAEQAGLPLPAVPMLLGAGVLVGMDHMSAGWALLGSAIACLAADLLWYSLGKRRGAKVLNWLCRIALEPDSCVRRAEDVFGRYGSRTLLVSKFVPGLNVASTPMAGVVRMGLGRFLFFDFLGTLLWLFTFGAIGFAFSRQVEDVAAALAHLGHILLLLLLTAIGAYVYSRYRQRKAFLKELEVSRVTPEELNAELDCGENVFIVDLRHPLDFLAYPFTIGNALRMAPAELEQRHQEIPRDRDIVLYCT